MKNGLEAAFRWFFIIMMSAILANALCSCQTEKEVQAKISTGTVIKVDSLQNRCVVKIKDNIDWIIYADYFDLFKEPPIMGQRVWIIVRR